MALKVRIADLKTVDKVMEGVLAKNSVTTVKKLYDMTRTSADRAKMAKQTGLPLENVEYLAVQAELLRIDNMTTEQAVALINAGIYSANDFRAMETKELLKQIRTADPKVRITLKQLEVLQKGNMRSATKFQTDTVKKNLKPLLQEQEKERRIAEAEKQNSMYSDLAEVIGSIGEGIAKAQLELDRQAIEVQNQILQDKNLAEYGMNATWYVIPEVNFEMKMDYTITEETNSEGYGTGKKRMSISPMNAKYNSIYRATKNQESTISMKFVPVPPDEKLVARVIVPDLKKLSKEEAITAMENSNLLDYEFVETLHKTTNGKRTEVYKQSKEAGSYMLIGEKLTVNIYRKN